MWTLLRLVGRLPGIFRLLVGLVRRHLDPVAYARSIGVTIGRDCRLIGVNFGSEPYLVTLGDHVSITRAQFITHDGGVWVFRHQHPDIDLIAPIRVGNNVFIGYGAIILPGVTIGDNVIIGAGAVVTRDIPSGSVAAGVPARVLKTVEEYYTSVAPRLVHTKGLSRDERRAFRERHFSRPASPPLCASL